MNLPQLPADKANHFAYGAALAGVGALHSVLAGAALCALFAIGKEVYDRVTKRGNPEVADAVATLLGAVPVLVPLSAWRLGVFA
jgi:hypothetical protein